MAENDIINGISTTVIKIQEKLNESFWSSPEFLISSVLGVAGLIFSFFAYVEAKKAKQAAIDAGEFIQIQSITIELNEMLHLLQSISLNIQYKEARDVLTTVKNKLRRYLASYKNDDVYRGACKNILDSLQYAQKALDDVKPSGAELENSGYGVVYYGIEGSFSIVCGNVSELMGLFERRAIDGEK